MLTRAEALALIARTHLDIDARVRGLAKIRTALDNVTHHAELAQDRAPGPPVGSLRPEPRSPEVGQGRAAHSAPPSAVPPLRAKHYGPMSVAAAADLKQRAQTYRPMTAPKCRIAKAVRPSPSHTPGASPAVDNYVPWRDEAGGIYE